MPRLSFSGFDRTDEANARAVFEAMALDDWSVSDEAGADAVLIDLDSIYGQMAWMKGLPAGKVAIGLTQALRADTPYRVEAPLSVQALRTVLLAVAQGRAVLDAPPAPTAPIVAPAASPAVAMAPPSDTAPAMPLEPAPPPVERLAVRLAIASEPFVVQVGDLPRLVVDPQTRQFAPGKSLKALLGYGVAEVPADAVTTLDAGAAAAALREAGDAQPLNRLAWLLALVGGGGQLLDHGPGTRFQLGKWPQAEREFPKHFRIATVMLKAPGTVGEIAAASGASEAEVADYINAALAVGHARPA